MSKIGQAAEEILEKISFGSYTKPSPVVDKKKSVEAKEGRRNIKKNKLTLYLTEEEEKKFNEIYISRLSKGKKCDRSALFAEAVDLLHKKECQGSK
jgi:hypothetical protein